MILAGDAGATKTELALFEIRDNYPVKVSSKRFFSNEFASLEEIVKAFLSGTGNYIESACIGAPGPVIGGKILSTNIPWILDEKILSENLNIRNFKLANDLELIATAVGDLKDEDCISVYMPEERSLNKSKVVLAPGTGLGQAALLYIGGRHIVVNSEGGHTDFAPSDKIEIELLKYLQKKFGHVSYERIASGRGLLNIYDFLVDEKYFEAGEELELEMKTRNAPGVITDHALAKDSSLCEKALDIFTSVLGAQAGNMVLTFNATGGVYLGGGIPLKIIQKLSEGTFRKSFLEKGRLNYLTESTPVFVIKDPSIALRGAVKLVSG